MKEVTNETDPDITNYATHHGIYRPEKSTTKLRVVFNCSSLTDNGISLNDIQYNGGVIQEDLYAQMLRFRTYTYAFTADIKMMYRTILINPKQCSLQRIVWCESEHESPKIYELSTVTYGTVSAPYLAQRTLTQLSMDEEANFPIAASVLRNNLYMDDVLCGAATLEEAIVLRQQLKGILKSAGMELHKLCANHEKLSPDPEQNYNFANLTETKTLGVSWKPNLDCLLIKVKVCLDSSYTKRDVLSTIAKIFDPVGLMAPVISKAKIFLKRLWRSKLEWNDLLPAEEYREWQQFLVSLENINNIEIPRRILVAFPEVIEIHGFADASERCYGAAVYCKSKNLKSETLVRLITSKSRVAPIKSLTIPRLELCAAVLLAKLVKRVVAALQLETAEVYLWSDSIIVLAWLRKEPMDLKTFVQNRVAKIQELYPNQLWRHVPSDQNPADLVSRGVDPEKLLQQNLWFNGPTFLSAVHIELVSDLTSQAFIAALKRFMARRGKCAKLFSDNGKNFVGASNEIKKLLEIVRKPDKKLANYLAAEGIEWKFIPARSPNFGEEPNLTKCKESNLKKWQKITKIVQLMWKFWSRNYLNQLQQRGKWMFEKNNVKIGDLVLIIEENLPTYKWALGRIVELYYGEDKKVRVVKIKTQYTTCKRAISKICVLPMEDP
ncbi:uncharacterized protein TNCV_364441 [Trichonephila clavipes]|uniref:Integrase catalytic domain-containing protein n=1 Tax=Trichonephila clavipes TaxID=2585209 RepID=A0A8X6SQ58_TRICX|nr:uncharacterized protein TNCV_364441 [Trichonephila clavipes]